MPDDGMIRGKGDDLYLAFTLISNCAQSIGFLPVTRELRIDQKQKAARDIHGLNDEPYCHVGELLHIENITDLFAISMQRAAGVEFVNIQQSIYPALDKR